MAEGRSPSTPVLPPVAGATGAQAKALKAKEAQQARMMRRRPTEMPKRQAFMAGLLNEDLQKLSTWHGQRPHHEQRRFLRSVDTMYKAFCTTENPQGLSKAQQAAQAAAQTQADATARHAAAQAAARAAEEDPLNGPPRSPREQFAPMGASASAPSLPIEVFEQRKRGGIQQARDPDAEYTSLDRWLEGGSVVTATTGTTATTRYTSLSQLTKTSSGGGSICSEPGTMNQEHYRKHKRGHALNKMLGANKDQQAAGALKNGLPSAGFPDSERMVTAFREQFGHKPMGENITPSMYQNIFKSDAQPFLARFLDTAPPESKDQFAGMVRSLQYLRTAQDRQTSTVHRVDYDLEENSRLYKPAKAKPWFDKSQSNQSKIPLGTLVQSGKGGGGAMSSEPQAPPPLPAAPPSPSVSGLGSVALSRLTTPLMGGKDLPMASAPMSMTR